MSADAAVIYVWDKLLSYGYRRPDLIGARWALRLVPCDVDMLAFQWAWDRAGSEARK